MNNKKCSKCGFGTNDIDIEVCPLCNEKLIEEIVVIEDGNTQASVLIDDTSKETAPKADKKVKIITASVAFVLVLVVGFFAWYMLGYQNRVDTQNSSTAKIADVNDIAGEYVAHDGVEYFVFKTQETKVELPAETEYMETMFEDMIAMSDGAVGSDSAVKSDLADSKKEYATFDGTYESGPTEKAVRHVLAMNYINNNNLSEEYSKYFEENDLYMDDFDGFIKVKGILQEELDALKEQLGLDSYTENYKTNGYWNYNKETGNLDLYDETGSKLLSSFIVSGDAIAERASVLTGKSYAEEKFKTTYTYNYDGYNDVLYFYEDGNYIIESTYQGKTEYGAGKYKSNKDFIKIKIGEKSQVYVKINDGIAGVSYIKQK